MTSDVPPRRPRGRPKIEGLADHRRTQIVEAAFAVLTEKGYDGTSIADIAQRAGMGQGTVYRYVNSKRELLDMVFDWAVEKTFATVDPYELLAAEAETARDMAANIQVIGDRLYRLVDDDPAILKLIGIQASAIDKELKARVVGLESLINSLVVRALERAVENEWFVLTEPQSRIVARLVMMLALPGVVMTLRGESDPDKRARLVGAATDLAFHGIMKRPAVNG
ncbi:helix-turn-helix domain-containing protein [Williamsia sp.]|uniref:TetR/AcrR family transcriptional regulator n=1 Tax=Williamsia sp. TaxID=1872085 RepID=UPI002F93460C